MVGILISKLKDLLVNSNKFVNVYTYEPGNLEGSPVATITPSGNEGDYQTTTENRRVYGFVARIYIQRGSGDSGTDKAEEAMRDLFDTILDTFDKNHQLSSLNRSTEVSTGYTFLFLEAAPGVWGYVGRDQEYRVAEINIKVHTYIDTNLIN